ncbi:hypothetical protein CBL_08417 [Carabus blaptoides fortunei]
MAGEEWFRSFRRRKSELSMRTARATSLSRPTSFNRTNVDAFHKKRDKVVAKRGSQQVGAFTSAERGTLVTVTFAANALGNAIPPLFVFPRVRHQDHFLRDGPLKMSSSSSSSSSSSLESLEELGLIIDTIPDEKKYQEHANPFET